MVWAEVEKQGFLDAALSPQPDKMRQRLRIAVEKAKRQLSNAMSAEVHVEALAGERNFTFKLERQTFERVNQRERSPLSANAPTDADARAFVRACAPRSAV
jgi:molecular chaperone DnaK (HSP70)